MSRIGEEQQSMEDRYPKLRAMLAKRRVPLRTTRKLWSALKFADEKDDSYRLADAILSGMSSNSMDSRSLQILAPTIEASARARCSPIQLIKTIATGLGSRYLTPDSLRLMAPTLEAVAKAGHNPYDIADALCEGLESKDLTTRSLRLMAPFLEATARRRQDPYPLATILRSGLGSKAIAHENLPRTALSLRKILEAAARNEDPDSFGRVLSSCFRSKGLTDESLGRVAPLLEATARAGHNPGHLTYNLFDSVEFKRLPPESFILLMPSLKAAAKAGHDPNYLAYPVLLGIKSKAITKKSLKRDSESLSMAFGASAKRGRDAGKISESLSSAFGSKILTSKSLPVYAGMFRTMPPGWAPGGVIENAVEAHELRVPADQIPHYQRRLMERGHFPNAGLVKGLHEAKMKEGRLKKRR